MKKYIGISIIILIVLGVINGYRIFFEFKKYNEATIDSSKIELETIKTEFQKVSDFVFKYIVNTPDVINLYKNAYTSNTYEKDNIRDKLYSILENDYNDMKTYGVQQLHFHLPNNESFLRFHKPQKYGDNLTNIRQSVYYVNKEHKIISGFEEGKIFNGYRYVYPLSSNNKHIGSVEISSSLLNFKKIYEKDNSRYVDYILLKSVVENKLFSSELKNYKSYFQLDDFLIQSTLHHYNLKNKETQKLLKVFLEDKIIQRKISTIDEYSFSKIINNKIYTINFIPLYNDFLHQKVGYSIVFLKSDYLQYFYMSVIGSSLSVIFLFVILVYIVVLKHKTTDIKIEKKRLKKEYVELLKSYQFNKSVIDSTDDLIFYKDKDFVYLGCNDSFSKHLGIDKDDIMGKTDFDLFDYETAMHLRNMDNIMFKENTVVSKQEEVRLSKGAELKLYTQRIPFKYDKKNLDYIGILGISRDVTEFYEEENEPLNT